MGVCPRSQGHLSLDKRRHVLRSTMLLSFGVFPVTMTVTLIILWIVYIMCLEFEGSSNADNDRDSDSETKHVMCLSSAGQSICFCFFLANIRNNKLLVMYINLYSRTHTLWIHTQIHTPHVTFTYKFTYTYACICTCTCTNKHKNTYLCMLI